MADYVLEEIIINILIRLPVKELLRCTTVCKSWYSLITSPHFISAHLKFSTPLLLLRRCMTSFENYELYSDTKSFSLNGNFEFPFRSMNSFFTIVGSCNGLLCLSDDRVYHMNTVIVWNPCVRKSVMLPKPNMIYNSHGSFTQCLGFGFDPVCNDYKVVRITYVDVAIHPQVEVYKMSSGVWVDMNHLELEHIVCNRSRQVYTHGAVHWLARYMDLYDLIVLFDMSREVFKTMKLLVSNDLFSSHDLAVYRDSVALISRSVEGFSVWVMQEYGVEESWSKIYSFDSSNIGNGFLRPLWMRKEGEVVVVSEDGRLVSYDRDGGEVKDLGVEGSGSGSGSRSDTYQHSLHVDGYMSSLVLLERGKHFDC